MFAYLYSDYEAVRRHLGLSHACHMSAISTCVWSSTKLCSTEIWGPNSAGYNGMFLRSYLTTLVYNPSHCINVFMKGK